MQFPGGLAGGIILLFYYFAVLIGWQLDRRTGAAGVAFEGNLGACCGDCGLS